MDFHTRVDDTDEISSSLGIEGVKQTARGWVWKPDGRQYILPVQHTAGGLLRPTLPRSWKQKT